jgi:hypothetical protein
VPPQSLSINEHRPTPAGKRVDVSPIHDAEIVLELECDVKLGREGAGRHFTILRQQGRFKGPGLPQSEITRNEEDYHHKPNNVDNTVHVSSFFLPVIGFTLF